MYRRQFLASVALAAAGAAVATLPAVAGEEWCELDPTVVVDGVTYHVTLRGPKQQLLDQARIKVHKKRIDIFVHGDYTVSVGGPGLYYSAGSQASPLRGMTHVEV
jgi:hypothetical protein